MPAFSWSPDAIGRGHVQVALEATDAEGHAWERTFYLPTRSPRLAVAGLAVQDGPPGGRGDGDGRPEVGETIRPAVVLSGEMPPDLNGLPARLHALDPRLDDKAVRLVLLNDGDGRVLVGPFYLLHDDMQPGDRLPFVLASQGPFVTWRDTFFVVIGDDPDRVPPQVLGLPATYAWEGGLTLMERVGDMIDGSAIAAVHVEVRSSDGERHLADVPLAAVDGGFAGVWPDGVEGIYVLIVHVTDAAGNEGSSNPGVVRVFPPPAPGREAAILGGGGSGSLGADTDIADPAALAAGADGTLWLADAGRHAIARRAPSGLVRWIAGHPGQGGDGGDIGDAADARVVLLRSPSGLARDPGSGDVYVAERGGHRVRRIGADGRIETVAGTGEPGTSGLGGPAVAAQLNAPEHLLLAPSGDLYIADAGNHRVVRLATDGTLRLVAGSGVAGFAGDGGAATAASLSAPRGLAADGGGGLYVADTGNNRVRHIDAAGTIRTVAGGGEGLGITGAGMATAASLDGPAGLAVDGEGALYVADERSRRVLRIDPNGQARTHRVGGRPVALAVTPGGDLYVGDADRGVVWLLVESVAPAPVSTAARLVLFDVLGRRVRELVDGPLTAGAHRVRWDGRDGDGRPAASGVYFARLRTGGATRVRRLTLLR